MNQYIRQGWSGTWVLAALIGMVVAARAEESAIDSAVSRGSPAFTLPPLPYAQDALAPYMSAKTMSFHYGKHHQAYVDNLNKLIAGTPWTGQPLDKIIRETAGAADNAAVFNNAAQVWNHTFFWQSMKAGGGGKPTGGLLKQIEKSFQSFDEFKKAFVTAALAQFGSGWVWLVQEGDVLKIVKTSNADTPMAHGQTALLTCDVWEHAYYLDYQNRRKDFVEAFLDHLANWEFAASQLK
jgi:Fe-Mn family superoxide dismutase